MSTAETTSGTSSGASAGISAGSSTEEPVAQEEPVPGPSRSRSSGTSTKQEEEPVPGPFRSRSAGTSTEQEEEPVPVPSRSSDEPQESNDVPQPPTACKYFDEQLKEQLRDVTIPEYESKDGKRIYPKDDYCLFCEKKRTFPFKR